MSSQSDYQQSSSSVDSHRKRENQNEQQKQHSRSRDRKSHRHEHHDDRSKKNNRKTLIKKPELDFHLVSFKAFQASQTEKISNERAQKEYEGYKREWEEYQNEIFLNDHKNDAWFKEKYDLEINESLEEERRKAVKAASVQFFKNLDLGVYEKLNLSIEDPPVNKDQTQTRIGFISNNDRDREEQQSTVVPINSQTVDISLNYNNDITKEPFFAFDPDLNTLFIKSIPKTVSRSDIGEVLEKLPGFKFICFSEPVKKMSFARYCWITFQNELTFKNAQVQMTGLIINKEPLLVSPSVSKTKRVKVLKKYPKSRLVNDTKVALKLIQVLDKQNDIDGNPLHDMQFPTPNKCFDLCLLYLRRVHTYDFFSGNSFDNERALSLRMGLAFLRIEADYEELPDFSTVFKKVQQAAEKRMQVQKIDYSNQIREEIQNMVLESQKMTRDQINTEMIWKCQECDKKFKTCEFLAKHILGKHQQTKSKSIKNAMEKAYLKDPNKITNYPTSREDRDYRGANRSRGGYRRDRRRDFRDLDEPQGDRETKPIAKPLVNFLDI